ncbi:hypothetical protein BDB00DRAFT_862504 [Zychaea mexicana]|uniref:uncharacterized protein n=1 Tax=Zychaea mexicana TaxID=64656 RepID=UPI0022FDC1C9|nr:uncharacterized protein BDB00DRAFT_862504 [Zychaea mexicana]KAI9471363.1 hypothetical protein BDB00DRAFT_862504 [Zychaea mexicana]
MGSSQSSSIGSSHSISIHDDDDNDNNQSVRISGTCKNSNTSSTYNTVTADRLWIIENAKKGAQAIGVTLMSPFVVIACPIIGAYEFGTALDQELLTGSCIVDGTLGFLLGVIASPIAPFLVMWQQMEVLFGTTTRPPPLLPSVEYRDHARQSMGLDSDNYYNVAIVGCPGTGKSALLNGLLGYKEGHADAAPVREAADISNTTTTVNAHGARSNSGDKSRGYKHPLLHSLMLWDMPSVNCGSAKQYFHRHCLGAFDALVIVSAERLMATDIKLARRAIDYDVPVFFVRNKADAAIASKIRKMSISNKNASKKSPAEKWASAVAQLTEEVDRTYCRTMRNFGFGTETLYIISAWALQDFVIALKDHKPTAELRLIHEKLLIINLLDAIAEHRRKCITTHAEQEHVDPMTLPV